MALSETYSSDVDDNGEDNLEENNFGDNNGDSDADDDVDEDILEALEDAIADDATDADEDSIYDSDDGSGEEDDAEELVGQLGHPSDQPVAPPSKNETPPNESGFPQFSNSRLSVDSTSHRSRTGSPTPDTVPPPRPRSPSPAFLRKTGLLSDPAVSKSYTIEAVCALPHPVPTHSLAASLCMTHMLTGSEDGYIRDYDIFTGLNGKNFLTAPQRHHCGVVEGLLKYAPLRFWWENPTDIKREDSLEDPPLSPVYSLLMHSDALWTLAGTHLGHINLFTLRHEPGRLCHILQGHRGPVSAMSMQHDEQGFFSAGWDGAALHWDLNTGQIVRNFTVHRSQMTSIAVRPLNRMSLATLPSSVNMDTAQSAAIIPPSERMQLDNESDGPTGVQQELDAKSDGSYDPLFDELDADGLPGNAQVSLAPPVQDEKPIPTSSDLSLPGNVSSSQFPNRVPSSSISKNAPPVLDSTTYSSYSPDVLMAAFVDGQIVLWDRRMNSSGQGVGRLFMNDKTPPWCASACWSADGAQIYAGRRNGTIDVWDVRQFGSRDTPRHLKILRNPASSGVVSCIVAFPDGRHLASASIDNIRLWNVAETGDPDGRKSKSGVQFKIIPGHHGGFVSQMLVDPAARFLISASGNRGWHGESTKTVFVHDVKHVR